MILLQFLIALTGNYAFFNLLTVALCLLLYDDAFLERFFPARPGKAAARSTAQSAAILPSPLDHRSGGCSLFSPRACFNLPIVLSIEWVPAPAFHLLSDLGPMRHRERLRAVRDDDD